MNIPNMNFEAPNLKYDYTQYSHDNDVNVIPDADYRRLVADTFKTICDTLRKTYGPYGSSVIITEQNQTTATKDGYNTFEAMHFSHNYKQQVYLTIQEIINRVNENVGDGTTSSILLAEKMFNELKDVAKNADDERKIKKILEMIESELQKSAMIEKDKKSGLIHKLNERSLFNIINLAANYDDHLTRNLVKAMDPQYDDKSGEIISVRNVIVDEDRDTDNTTNVEYSYEYLPGDYRINVTIHPDLGREWIVPQKLRILICDHTFSDSDWMKFDNGKIETDTPVLVIARAVTQKFFDEIYTKRYVIPRLSTNQDIKYYFCEMKGGYIRNEIKDLCAVLGIKPMTFETVGPVDLEYYTKEHKISISNGNCLCFYDCEPATEYAETLKFEMKSDLSKSITKKGIWESRINACLLRDKDTLFKIRTGNRLQSKLIVDKITDCCSIIKSAVDNGVTPNLLSYGHNRIRNISDTFNSEEGTSLTYQVCNRIIKAIEGLFDDIWYSKYGYIENENTRKANETGREICKDNFYNREGTECSFDIVTEQLCSYEEYPTSSQYDIEVLVAGITIVKYMLTSKAFIFDSCLLKPHGDKGHMDMFE